MSTLNTAQRKALPLTEFGDPSRRLYPIVDQDDVDSAARLIGKANDPEAVKRRIIAIAKRKGLKVPDAWKAATHSRATFAAEMFGETPATDGDMVVRTGLLFRTGEYADQSISITPDELRTAADAFTEGYVELEHLKTFGVDTILDGQTGEVRGVWASEDGTELYGDVALPVWLDKIAGQSGHKVSSVFDRETKSFMGVGLVLDPQVTDAALFSAYATFATRHDTPHGQRAMQHLHDVAAGYGAVCTAGNAGMASRHESTGVQAIHDTAMAHGAKCASRGRSGVSDMALYSKPPTRQEKGRRMNLKFWQKTTPAERAELKLLGAEVPDEAVFSAARELADTEMAEERARLQEALRVEQAKRLQSEAATFAKEQIQASKAFPGEREPLIAAYLQAAMDDATHGAATFSGAKVTSRVEALRAMFAARQPHGLTKEGLDPTQAIRLMPATFAGQEQEGAASQPTEEGKAIAPERRAYLLKLAGAEATKKEA